MSLRTNFYTFEHYNLHLQRYIKENAINVVAVINILELKLVPNSVKI